MAPTLSVAINVRGEVELSSALPFGDLEANGREWCTTGSIARRYKWWVNIQIRGGWNTTEGTP